MCLCVCKYQPKLTDFLLIKYICFNENSKTQRANKNEYNNNLDVSFVVVVVVSKSFRAFCKLPENYKHYFEFLFFFFIILF